MYITYIDPLTEDGTATKQLPDVVPFLCPMGTWCVTTLPVVSDSLRYQGHLFSVTILSRVPTLVKLGP
jgi:hypothetical protein